MSKRSFSKKNTGVLTSEVIFSKLCNTKVEQISTHVFLRVFVRKFISQIWVILASNPVGTAQRSRTKSESLSYHVVIMTGNSRQHFSQFMTTFSIVLLFLNQQISKINECFAFNRKNPAFGRHKLSRPMRIVGPKKQKNVGYVW